MDGILSAFDSYPSQKAVATFMLRRGIGVSGGKAVCGDAEISDSALGRACGVDRRVVRSTMERIESDPYLSGIFSGLEPIALLSGIASKIGCTALEIIPTDASQPGILSQISNIIGDAGVSITQAVIDGTGDASRLKIVLDGPLPEGCLMRIRMCRGVDSVIIR